MHSEFSPCWRQESADSARSFNGRRVSDSSAAFFNAIQESRWQHRAASKPATAAIALAVAPWTSRLGPGVTGLAPGDRVGERYEVVGELGREQFNEKAVLELAYKNYLDPAATRTDASSAGVGA